MPSSAGSMDMLDQLSDLQEMTTLPEGSQPGHRTGYWRQTSPGGDAVRQSQEGARTPTGFGRSGRGGGQRSGGGGRKEMCISPPVASKTPPVHPISRCGAAPPTHLAPPTAPAPGCFLLYGRGQVWLPASDSGVKRHAKEEFDKYSHLKQHSFAHKAPGTSKQTSKQKVQIGEEDSFAEKPGEKPLDWF